MEYETIKYENEEGIGIITLNRPSALNSLSTRMYDELLDVGEEAMKDDEVKVLIITGAPRPDGRPCFSAGADLKELASGTFSPKENVPMNLLNTIRALETGERAGIVPVTMMEKYPKLLIAAVDGICTAGGLEIALSCDIIFVSETARISDMHVKNTGNIGGDGCTARLAGRIGVSKAIELCTSGDTIDGKEAYRIGFANQVFPPDKLLDGAKEFAKKIVPLRPAAVTAVKATCKAIYEMDYRSAYRLSDAYFTALYTAESGGAEWGAQRWVEEKKG